MRSRAKWGICAALLAVAVAAVPVAVAAEATPVDEYKERAEPICKSNVEANKNIFKGVRKLVNEGRLKKASAHFRRAATAFGKTITQLAAIPQPPEYEVKLAKWLQLLRAEKGIIGRIGKALASEDKGRAERLSLDLRRNTNRANNTVLAFGFNYCRIEQSRFG